MLVGVCGSIAAYKACEVVRGLVKDGADVQVVMTPPATRFVGAATFSALSGRAAVTDIFEEPERVAHVELARWAESFVICGATASTLSRLASGDGSDAVSAAYLMARCPVLVAPAMHTEMWEHPAVVRNVAVVAGDGSLIVPPGEGDLASGDYGVGRLADVGVIVEAVRRSLSPRDLAGLRVLVTAGPTREPLDPVRFLSNRSSGRMGFALATEALRRGAAVTLIAGPTRIETPWGADVVAVETAAQMEAECLARFEACDLVVMNAAVADWRPVEVSAKKVKKAQASRSIELEPTNDIAAELGRRKGDRVLVVFAAETDNVVSAAETKLVTKNADVVVANLVAHEGTGFDSETNDAVIVTEDGSDELPRLTKDDLAATVWDLVVQIHAKRRQVH